MLDKEIANFLNGNDTNLPMPVPPAPVAPVVKRCNTASQLEEGFSRVYAGETIANEKEVKKHILGCKECIAEVERLEKIHPEWFKGKTLLRYIGEFSVKAVVGFLVLWEIDRLSHERRR